MLLIDLLLSQFIIISVSLDISRSSEDYNINYASEVD